MKIKKLYIYITAVISVISLILLAILQFRLHSGIYEHLNMIIKNKELLVNFKEFGINILGGIFTGSILTFLLSVIDYFNERKNALEEIYFASEELWRPFNKIKFFLPDEPWELIRNYFQEMDINRSIEETNQMLEKTVEHVKDKDNLGKEFLRMKSRKSYEAERKFKEHLWEQLNDAEKQGYDKEIYINQRCAEKTEKYIEQIMDVIESYLRFNDMSTNRLSAAYGKLDFMFSNDTKRKHIHEYLYQKQYDQIMFIKVRLARIDDYFKQGAKNKLILLDIIGGFQRKLLTEDENFYYKQYSYDVCYEMVRVLTYLNGKKNSREFPEKKHFIAKHKPGAYARLQEEYEKSKEEKNI